MGGILLEWLTALVALGLMLYLLYALWVRFTWRGKQVHQQLHRAYLAQGAQAACAAHGTFPVADAIPTERGLMCPRCFAQAVQVPTILPNTLPPTHS